MGVPDERVLSAVARALCETSPVGSVRYGDLTDDQQSSYRQRAAYILAAARGMTGADPFAVLTADEHAAMHLTGDLANLMRRIIGTGPQAAPDWTEAALRIHAVQHMILAQAAARAYPDEYRLLGELLERIVEDPT